MGGRALVVVLPRLIDRSAVLGTVIRENRGCQEDQMTGSDPAPVPGP
jgi:hypothetical protein